MACQRKTQQHRTTASHYSFPPTPPLTPAYLSCAPHSRFSHTHTTHPPPHGMPKAPPLLPCFVRTLFERFDPHVRAAQNPNAREPTLRRGSGNSAALRPLPPRASPFFSTFRLFCHAICVAALCHPCYVCAPRTAYELMERGGLSLTPAQRCTRASVASSMQAQYMRHMMHIQGSK